MILPTTHNNGIVFMWTYFDWLYYIMKIYIKQFIETNDASWYAFHLTVLENTMTSELWKTELSEYLQVELFIQQIEHPPFCKSENMAVNKKWNEGSKNSHKDHHSIREMTFKASSQSRLALLCGNDGKKMRLRTRQTCVWIQVPPIKAVQIWIIHTSWQNYLQFHISEILENKIYPSFLWCQNLISRTICRTIWSKLMWVPIYSI